MHKYDASMLAANLNGLAEAFDKKPLTPKALEIWFDALKEFATGRVLAVLSGWAKFHAKFPSPSEVWKEVNEIGIREREMEAAQATAMARAPVTFAKTQAGADAMQIIRRILDHPKPTPTDHWEKVLRDHPRGTISHEYATEALKILRSRHGRQREPGEDEAEAA